MNYSYPIFNAILDATTYGDAAAASAVADLFEHVGFIKPNGVFISSAAYDWSSILPGDRPVFALKEPT